MAQPGDKVKITASTGEYTGRFMPSRDEHIVAVKLDSGYNIGIQKDSVTNIEVIEAHKDLKKELKKPAVKKGLPTISILHTGGTIASKIDYRTGGVFSSFKPEELLAMFPELAKIANFDSNLVSNMWSDDLRFNNMITLAKAIESEIKKGVDGIIVGMGTDNLAVCSAAISFMIQDSPIPIIFVGSQRSSDRGSSDAAMNLICASEFIAKSDFSGVGICMHHTSNDDVCAILSSTKTYKLHSSRRDAFRAVNDIPYAFVDYKSKEITFTEKEYMKKDKERPPTINCKMEDKVGLLKIHVNMHPEIFRAFKGFKGLVLEGTGLGHTPTHAPNDDCLLNLEIAKALKELIDEGCVVVMTLQTLYGRTQMRVYSKGRDLLEMGVLSGEDMLATTALVKLSWLLANKENVKGLVGENIVGEISDRTLYTEHFT